MNWREATATEVLREAQALVERHSDFQRCPANWAMQKAHEADWALPTIELLRIVQVGPVLDLGCGYGTLAVAAHLLGYEVLAMDYFVPSPAVPGVEWRHANIEEPGAIPEGPWRVIILTEVLEHLNFHPARLLSDLYCTLELGGFFLGATPAPEKWTERAALDELSELPQWVDGARPIDAHIYFYSEHELKDLLLRAHFSVECMCLISGGYRRYWQARKKELS